MSKNAERAINDAIDIGLRASDLIKTSGERQLTRTDLQKFVAGVMLQFGVEQGQWSADEVQKIACRSRS